MSNHTETALTERKGPDQTFQDMVGHLNVKKDATIYSFEILNVSQILTEINISNERQAAGWVFYRGHDQVLFLFDIRENGLGDYKKPVTVIMAEVLSHGCILQMGFIVDSKAQFIKKLNN